MDEGVTMKVSGHLVPMGAVSMERHTTLLLSETHPPRLSMPGPEGGGRQVVIWGVAPPHQRTGSKESSLGSASRDSRRPGAQVFQGRVTVREGRPGGKDRAQWGCQGKEMPDSGHHHHVNFAPWESGELLSSWDTILVSGEQVDGGCRAESREQQGGCCKGPGENGLLHPLSLPFVSCVAFYGLLSLSELQSPPGLKRDSNSRAVMRINPNNA